MKETYYSPGDFILRTPTFSISTIENISMDLPGLFKHLATNDFFLASIYIASTQLYREYVKWIEGELTNEKEEERLMSSLFKYWLRMSTRCTPYGSFAGCTLGEAGSNTKLLLEDTEFHQAHSRVDMNVIAEMIHQLSKKPELRLKSIFFPNNSAYFFRDELRYIEYTINNNIRGYKVSEVKVDEFLKRTLNRASGGATIPELARELIDDEITEEEAYAFIEELIESKVLISELEPTVTGEPFFEALLEKLKALNEDDHTIRQLADISNRLGDTSLRIEKLEEVQKMIRAIVPSSRSKDLIQTDLYLATSQATIKTEIIENVIDVFQKLIRINTGKGDVMAAFKRKFLERYDTAEVPLMQALDPETGVGYESHFANSHDNITFLHGINANPRMENNPVTAWTGYRDLQLRKLNEALLNGYDEIVITDEDLTSLGDNSGLKIPDSFNIIGTLLGNDREIDEGSWRFSLTAGGGPSAVNLFGRFCHLDDVLTEKARKYLEEEESHHPDSIFAEIVHFPQARLANIIIRPILRTHEIPYVTASAVPKENQLQVADLFVSIQNNEVILRSKRLNKRIIPRLSTAHNYNGRGNLPVYRFLCDLQYQGLAMGYSWDWGKLESCAYLPRVTCGKIIVSRAQWRVEKKTGPSPDKDSNNLIDYFANLLKGRKVPRFVTISEEDNELFIDLKNENCLKILMATLTKRKIVVLKEFLSIPDQCLVKNKKDLKFTNEVIIPVSKKKNEFTSQSVHSPITVDKSFPQRTFIPGSEWFYLKIYCGIKSAEEILKNAIKPLVSGLLEERIIDQWFFIRYTDPNHHLRIRFHGLTADYHAVLLNRVNRILAQFIADGFIQNIQIDTYQRELERYGNDLIDVSEKVFYYDSEAVIHFVDLLETDEDEQYRWLFALRGADMLMDDFRFSLEEKALLMKGLSRGFLTEFANEKFLLKQINERYRADAKKVTRILTPENDREDEVEEAVAIFKNRSVQNSMLYTAIADRYPDGYKHKVKHLISSYLHMFLNRLFQSNQRKQELIVYNYLYRYYESSAAIKKKQSAMESSPH